MRVDRKWVLGSWVVRAFSGTHAPFPQERKREKGSVDDSDKPNVLRQAEELFDWAALDFQAFARGALEYCDNTDRATHVPG